jgi:TonB-linked SusC/RagA family outer membrane protein
MNTINHKNIKKDFFSSKLSQIFNIWLVLVLIFVYSDKLYSEEYIDNRANNIYKVQQTRKTVKGKVTDTKGEPLPGVAVQITGRQGGVITDVDGNFTIEVESNDQLRFQYVGMKPVTIVVGNKSVLNIKMEEDVEILDEVTVTAFATQKKESVVSSIETINPKELKVPSSNLTTALAGRLAGIISYQRSGEPGADNAQFFVRGVTTFGYASSPLILLDGFEVDANDLARVDPDNIASFSVLKDATSAALYGSKGANGVILVTTKKGQSGKTQISFRAEGRVSAPTKIQKTVDGVTYMNLYNQAQFNDNPLLEPYYSAQKIQNTIDNLNEYAYPNINWYDEMFKSQAFNQHYNLNVTGGGTAVKYYMSLSYDKDQGILKDNRLNNFKNNINIDNFNILTNITMDLSPTTKLDINMNSIFENYTGPVDNTDVIFASVMNSNPVEFPKFYLPDEAHAYVKHTLFGSDATGTMSNPFANMVRGYKDGSTGRITTQFSFDQNLDVVTKGLNARAKVSIKSDTYSQNIRSYDPYLYNIKSYDEFTDTYVLQEVHKGTDALGNPSPWRDGTFRMYIETGLTYAHRFNNTHDFSGLLIYTQEEIKNTSGNGGTIQATLPQRLQGLRGRVNYGYKDKYLAELSLTYTGSEKFARQHRWGLFPAMGVGYLVSNEPYWEPMKNILPLLKFKYSLGQVGNDQISSASDRFFFLSDITSGNGYSWGKDFNTNYGGFNISRYANPEITWEIAVKQNIGVEFDLLKNSPMKFVIEYFTEDRKQIYQARANLPETMGLTSAVYGNVGEVKSKGWDGSLDLNYSFNKYSFIQGRLNFTYAHNKIVQNEEPQYRWPYLSDIGWPINTWKGYIAERLFIDEADVANSPSQELGGTVQPGDIKYKDINNDGRINSDDQVHIGYPIIPEITYGFGLSGGYKRFDISFFMQGQDRVSFFINPTSIAPFANKRNALQYIADDHWEPNNPVAQAFWPRLSASYNNNNNVSNSTWWIRNGRFLRLKTAEIGYNVPDKWANSIRAKSMRLYFTGQNLFNITSFKLWDPEMGGEGFNYPLQKVYSIGVNVSF